MHIAMYIELLKLYACTYVYVIITITIILITYITSFAGHFILFCVSAYSQCRSLNAIQLIILCGYCNTFTYRYWSVCGGSVNRHNIQSVELTGTYDCLYDNMHKYVL